MIPVLVTAILNRPDLLSQMLESVDVGIDRLVIVDNGDVVHPTTHLEDRWQGHLQLIQPGHNLGVAASWNLGLKVTPDAPWWFICGFDMTFGPGDLSNLATKMDLAPSEDPFICFVEGFSAFALNRAALETIGYFDENLHPAYFEDNDYQRRAHLAGVRMTGISHASKHVGSATIYSDPSYREQNHGTFESNKAYYLAKWGGMPGQERWGSPFNGMLGTTEGGAEAEPPIEPARIRKQAWRRS